MIVKKIIEIDKAYALSPQVRSRSPDSVWIWPGDIYWWKITCIKEK